MKKTLFVFALALFSASAVCRVEAADASPDVLKLSAGFDFSTGKYGTSSATDILQIPFTAAYESGPVTLKVTVPYLWVSGTGDVVVGGADGLPVVGIGTAERRTESGIGDIVAGVIYNALFLPEHMLLVDLGARVKFPTADETRGLGTGKTDYSFQADVAKAYGESTLFGTIGYKVFGKPDGYTLDNTAFASAGGDYEFAPGARAGLIFDIREAASPGSPAPFESTAYLSRDLSKDLNLSGYLMKGFSDGSPDYGFGLQVLYRM